MQVDKIKTTNEFWYHEQRGKPFLYHKFEPSHTNAHQRYRELTTQQIVDHGLIHQNHKSCLESAQFQTPYLRTIVEKFLNQKLLTNGYKKHT